MTKEVEDSSFERVKKKKDGLTWKRKSKSGI